MPSAASAAASCVCFAISSIAVATATSTAAGVGDLLCFDISHPCLTFDKWRHLLVVDAAQRVVGAVTTHF